MANPLSVLAPMIAKLRIPIQPRFIPHARAIGAVPEVQQFVQNRTVEATAPYIRNKYSPLGEMGSMVTDLAPFFIKNTPTGIIAQELLAPSYVNAVDEVAAIKARNKYVEKVKYPTLKTMNNQGL